MDNRQAKLTSVDFLLVLLVRFGVCSEPKAFGVFQWYRHDIFYKHGWPAGIGSKLQPTK
jgi:hypothetical protein